MMKNWLWALIAGVTMGTVFGACGDGLEGESLACSADTDCLEGEVCVAGTCAVTCESGDDCPSSAKTCGDFTANGTTQKVCQCSTDQLCNSEGAVDLVCQPFALCTPKCGTDTGYSCPTGFSCDDTTGKCAASAGCQTNADCASGETCNDQGVCEAATACDPNSTTVDPTTKGISTCEYGEFCQAGSPNTCAAVPNETSASCADAAGAPTWNASAEEAPVIRSVTAVKMNSTDPTTECAGGEAAIELTISYYSPTPLFTGNDFTAFANQIKWKNRASFNNAQFPLSMMTAGQNAGTFKVGVACGQATQAGDTPVVVYLTDSTGARTSNVVCAPVSGL